MGAPTPCAHFHPAPPPPDRVLPARQEVGSLRQGVCVHTHTRLHTHVHIHTHAFSPTRRVRAHTCARAHLWSRLGLLGQEPSPCIQRRPTDK